VPGRGESCVKESEHLICVNESQKRSDGEPVIIVAATKDPSDLLPAFASLGDAAVAATPPSP